MARLDWVRTRRGEHSRWSMWHLVGAGGVSLCGSLDTRRAHAIDKSAEGVHRGERRCERCKVLERNALEQQDSPT